MRADNRAAEMVKRNLSAIGYTELSYFRQDEAEEILDLLRPSSNAVQEATASRESAPAGVPQSALELPDDLVDCPLAPGERRSKSAYCEVSCPDRKAAGFCPILGEDPESDGGMI